jgi:thiol-disulfide isomerase/thioredoxin
MMRWRGSPSGFLALPLWLVACDPAATGSMSAPVAVSRPVTLVEAPLEGVAPAGAAAAAPSAIAGASSAQDPLTQREATRAEGALGGPGWLGVALSGRPQDQPGALVSNVLRRSPAALGGLEVGDIVLGVNGQPVLDPAQLSHFIAAMGAGGRANLMVQRGSEQRLLAVPLAHNPGLEGQLRLGFLDAPAPELAGVEVALGSAAPTLQSLRGRVVVLEFWATWCGACRALLPTLNAWQERFAPAGAQVLSVTVDPAGKAAQDAAQLGMRYAVLADPQGQTAQLYQAFALPTLFVIDRAGVVRDVSVGYDPARIRALEAMLQRLIAEPG